MIFNILMFSFECLLAIIGMCFTMRFYEAVFGKLAEKRTLIYIIAAAAILAVTIISGVFLNPFRPSITSFSVVVTSFLFLMFFKGSFQKKLMFSLIILGLSMAWVMLFDSLSSPIPFEQKNPWVIVFLFHFGFWIMLEIAKHFAKQGNEQIPPLIWAFYQLL